MEWACPSGSRWLWEAPCARDVVHLISHLLPALDQGQGWRELAAWLSARVIDVDGLEVDGASLDWGRLSRGERVRIVEQLAIEEMDALAAHILLSLSLPAELLAQVRQLARVTASGGCECRRCKQADQRGPLAACLYHGIGDEAEQRLDAWWPLRETDLSSAEWWMWQMRRAWEAGRAEAIIAARKKADQRKQIDDLLDKTRGR